MFAAIDEILEVTARDLGLCWVREYKGEEVRSAEVSLGAGRFAQLWVERSNQAPYFVVCAWDYKHNRLRESSSLQNLRQTLSNVVSVARSWGTS